MDLEDKLIRMIVSSITLECGKMTSMMAKEFAFMMTHHTTRACGPKVSKMEKENLYPLTAKYQLARGTMVVSKIEKTIYLKIFTIESQIPNLSKNREMLIH